jgi:hypothetical protein
MRKLLIIFFIYQLSTINYQLFAGNEDRTGNAGAPELLINPWARSGGWGSVNTGCVQGVEAIFGDVAGIAFTKHTEIIFSHSIYLKGTGIGINAFGLSQKAGKTGVIALAVMAMNFGDIPITTVDNSDGNGGLGTYSPKFMNINIAYGKAFSNSIYGGINLKIIYDAIPDVAAQGIAIDAGIQYVTGEKENIKFGIALKNWGTDIKYSGSGLTFPAVIPNGISTSESTVSKRAANSQLPSLVNIGASYDFLFSAIHTLTAAVNFTSNSFSKDQYTLGLEYGFYKCLYLRAGFTYEQGLFNIYDGNNAKKTRTTPYTGPSAGLSVDVPLNKEKGTKFTFDYSYKATDPFQGTHSFGARISL